MIGIKNELHFFSSIILSIVVCFYLYYRCKSHQQIKKTNAIDRLSMNWYQKMDYRKNLYCSLNASTLLLIAVLIPLAVFQNQYQNHTAVILFILFLLIFTFGLL